ncbi:uncharacterized protein LOC125646786 isoform X2 [Ostrea edulis]|uniref:uncharacterized protein LOC125646786 isoform X2 n=1 Tax=Ostrea edulis TaxID=37623 RepID=UPI0024AFB60A|nr:uncharacterized protein LOC125646786 isoform X2 [Ostrea edulis]
MPKTKSKRGAPRSTTSDQSQHAQAVQTGRNRRTRRSNADPSVAHDRVQPQIPVVQPQIPVFQPKDHFQPPQRVQPGVELTPSTVGLVQEPGTYSRPQPSANPSFVPEAALSSEISRLLHSSLSANTNQAYMVGIQAFNHFRSIQGLPNTWPPPDAHINTFIAHLSIHGYKQSTAKAYISAISFYCKLHWNADPTKHFIVQKLLQGMKRTNSISDARLPITLGILELIINKLQVVCSSTNETLLFKASFSLAFNALLRIGEFALSKGNSVDRVLHTGDISLHTNYLTIHIRYSKTDQLGRGTTLTVHKMTGTTCPIQAMHDYIEVRAPKAGPLFCHYSGQPLTRFQFTSVLSRSLNLAGIDSRHFKSHSFRIGAATTLAQQGMSAEVIQAAGRWRSVAYQSYIR